MKVLIVDDEVIARIGLTNAIDWKANGLYIVGDTADAQTALAMARQNKPDIVIVDIVMPEVNGLELIRMMKKEIPLSKFIIISCMDDKEYYKEALQLGVSGYINKATFRKEQLLEVLQEVSKSISQDRVVDESYDETYHMNRFAILANFLNLAIRTGRCSREQVLEKLNSFDVELHEPYRLVVVRTEGLPEDVREYIEQSASVICYDIIRAVGEGFVFKNTQKELVAVISGSIIREEYVQGLCRRIQTTLKQYFDFTPAIGVSGYVHDLGKLRAAYEMAEKASGMQFFYGPSIFVYHKTEDPAAVPEACRRIIDELMQMTLETPAEEVRQKLEELRSAILESRFYNVPGCQDLYLCFLYQLYNLGRQMLRGGVEIGAELEPSRIVRESVNLQMLGEKTAALFESIQAEVQKAQEGQDDVLQRVEAYVRQHICERIHAEDIASAVYLSPAYLGRIFKRESGMNLNAYINEQKIEYSKQELLRRRDVNAVADALNFSTPSYFISLFKAHVGMTPKQFIRENSGKKRTEQEA